jgi:hypothetical protein
MKGLKVKEMWLRASLFFAAALLTAVESHAQNVVTQWNSIASATIIAHGGKPPASSGVWFAYTSIAEYDAVNAIHHQFQPFYYKGSAPDSASEEAAAVAAAHRVLVNYFPAQQPALDAQFVASLANISATPDAKAAGIATGEAAAAALIAARAGDGLDAMSPIRPEAGPASGSPRHLSSCLGSHLGSARCAPSR